MRLPLAWMLLKVHSHRVLLRMAARFSRCRDHRAKHNPLLQALLPAQLVQSTRRMASPATFVEHRLVRRWVVVLPVPKVLRCPHRRFPLLPSLLLRQHLLLLRLLRV